MGKDGHLKNKVTPHDYNKTIQQLNQIMLLWPIRFFENEGMMPFIVGIGLTNIFNLRTYQNIGHHEKELLYVS